MWEDNDALHFLKLTVHDPVEGLESPPATDEGWIHSVEFDRTEPTALEHTKKTCQECGEPVRTRDPHVRAHVILESSIAPRHKNPYFCDRECWAAWASA